MARPIRLALLLGSVAFAASLSAQVTTYTWTGAAATVRNSYGYLYATANASNAANWDTAPVSSGTSTRLVFGASANLASGNSLTVTLPASFEANAIVLNSPRPSYNLQINDGGTFSLGSGGITAAGQTFTELGNGTLNLLASQTWNFSGSFYVDAAITGSSTATLTQAGSGWLMLGNSNSVFSGGFTLQGGSLYLTNSSTWDATLAQITRGPVGTGRLTLGDYTTLGTDTTSDITLHNAITLGTHVDLENYDHRLTLGGDITPTSTDTVVHLGYSSTVFLKGAIGNAPGGATALTFTTSSSDETSGSFPVVVLTGANTYSGATLANGVGVIFYANGSLGQTTSVQATNSGYIGTGYSGGMEAILAKVAGPNIFDGALGFDTDPNVSSTATVFTDNVNLASFTNDNGGPTSGFWGLGSLTSATLRTGTITPPTGGNYVFGGGSGKLYVETALTAPSNSPTAGVRVRTVSGDDPLTVYLRGANTFTGNLMSDHSIVVLDSATALPTGSSFSVDSGAYVGYTENFTAGGSTTVTPSQFIARLAGTSYNADSVLGFDSANSAGRAIADPIDLSAFTNNVFLGTATHVHLTSDTLKAPATGKLSVTGVAGGWLTLDGKLQSTNLTSLFVGNSGNDSLQRGYVEITNAINNYTGHTEFQSGYLLVGASSTVSGSTITQGPLGTGELEIEGHSWSSQPTLVATSANVTLHNNIVFDSGSSLQFGVPITTDTGSADYPIQAYTGNGFTLNGNLSGTPTSVAFRGNSTFTLNGDNSSLAAFWGIQIGNSTSAEGTPLVIAATNTALGAGNSPVSLRAGADLQFTTSAPSVGSLSGGDSSSYIIMPSGMDSILRVNQLFDATFYGHITGPLENRDISNAPTPVNTKLVKDGSGTLTLAGSNYHTTNTTINAGTIVAAATQSLGSGSVTLNGGSLVVASGVTITNPIVFGANGGVLGGNGTFGNNLTIGTGVKLAPGNSPGVLTFTNGLTLASGGSLSIDVADLFGTAGVGYDQVKVTGGTFSVTGADASFDIRINSLTSFSGGYGALSTDYSAPASLTIIDSVTPLSLTDLAKFSLNTTNFTTYQPGNFSLTLSADSTDLILNFTPVPEPSTYALFALGLGFVGLAVRRQRRR